MAASGLVRLATCRRRLCLDSSLGVRMITNVLKGVEQQFSAAILFTAQVQAHPLVSASRAFLAESTCCVCTQVCAAVCTCVPVCECLHACMHEYAGMQAQFVRMHADDAI